MENLNNGIDLILERECITITTVLSINGQDVQRRLIAECKPKKELYTQIDTLVDLGYELTKISVDGDNECLLLEYSLEA
ncbi:hypothetical protein IJ556_01340 [bacterium]|nr:hypothetical protein [bacterium]